MPSDAAHQTSTLNHTEEDYRVRFRIDGLLKAVAKAPNKLNQRIAARLKVMSQLDIAEKRVPQDGRIKLNLSKTKQVDFRVSTLPTLFGESGTAYLGWQRGKAGYRQTRLRSRPTNAFYGSNPQTLWNGTGHWSDRFGQDESHFTLR